MCLDTISSDCGFLQLLLDKPRESIQVGVVCSGHPVPIAML